MNDPLTIGALAPDFELPADDGHPVRLSTLRGRKIVLYFYPRDDTSGCTREAIDFNGLRRDFASVGADIFGISADSVASHQKFKKSTGSTSRCLPMNSATPSKLTASGSKRACMAANTWG